MSRSQNDIVWFYENQLDRFLFLALYGRTSSVVAFFTGGVCRESYNAAKSASNKISSYLSSVSSDSWYGGNLDLTSKSLRFGALL